MSKPGKWEKGVWKMNKPAPRKMKNHMSKPRKCEKDVWKMNKTAPRKVKTTCPNRENAKRTCGK